MDSLQSEANALLKRLNETTKKVSNSVEEVKEQYVTVLEVGEKSLPTIKAFSFFFFGLKLLTEGDIEIPCIFPGRKIERHVSCYVKGSLRWRKRGASWLSTCARTAISCPSRNFLEPSRPSGDFSLKL